MVERAPQLTKQDEQYPLLKVDGGGDGGVPQQPTPTLVTPGWSVTCAPKQSWIVRWPEYISACWMTLILLGISFLVFYSLGMEAYRRQPVLLIKSNSSKPGSDVFFHQILPRGTSEFLSPYTEYLSSVANEYPSLHFHVYFLVDDSTQGGYRVPRHPRFINSLIPISLSNTSPLYKLDENNRRELAEFQRKHHNINVTIMPLSMYMAMTPLKYKWRNIPVSYLTFYARVFSVWQYGGVSMDLWTFNNYYSTRHYVDRRITAILRQHNDGINLEEYVSALNKIDREEENEFFSIFYGLVHSILNETRSFLSKTFPMPRVSLEKDDTTKNEPLIRLHRNKRDIPTTASDNNITEKSPVFVDISNSTNNLDLKKNEYQTVIDSDVNQNISKNAPKNDTTKTKNLLNLGQLNKTQIQAEMLNKTEHPQLVFFYDFSVFSDNIAPSVIVPEALNRVGISQNDNSQNDNKDKDVKPTTIVKPGSYLLSLHAEGLFIASSARLHPLLSHLLCAGCSRMHPRAAIQYTILTQCSGILKEDMYCNNIYLL